MKLHHWLSGMSKFTNPRRKSRAAARRRQAMHPIAAECLEERVLLSSGELDPSFGNDGAVVSTYFDVYGSEDVDGRVVVALTDGRFLVGGQADDLGVLARYQSNGELDPTFGVGGRLITGHLYEVSDLIVLSNGNILATGPTDGSTGPTGDRDFGVIRLLTDGTLDRTFGNEGRAIADFSGFHDTPNSIGVQSDGKIIVAGRASTDQNSTKHDFGVVRFSTSGNLDTSFNTTGKRTIDFSNGDDIAYDLAIDSTDRIVLAGSTDSTTNYDFALARLEANGTPDNTFGTNGRVTTDFGQQRDDKAFSVVLQSGGFIVAGGYAEIEKVGHTDKDFALARYNSSGQLQGGFGTNGRMTTDFTTDSNFPSEDSIYGLALQSDSQIVAVGTLEADTHSMGLARYAGVTGQLDASLDPNSGGRLVQRFFAYTDTAARGVALAPDGDWVVVGFTGHAYATTHEGAIALARFNATNGQLRSTFGNGGRVVTGFASLTLDESSAFAVVTLSDGSKIVAGAADDSGAIAKYLADGSLDESFGVGGRLVTSLLKEIYDIVIDSEGRILATGSANSGTDFGVIRILPNGVLDRGFGRFGLATAKFDTTNDVPWAIALQSDGKIIVAGDSTPKTGSTNRDFAVVRFSTSGNLDTSFNTTGRRTIDFHGFEDRVYDVAIDDQQRILLVGSATDNTDYDFALARLESGGTIDNTFGTDGKVTTDFGQNRDDEAFSVVLQTGGFIVAAGSAELQKTSHTDSDFALARYNSSGNLQGGFGTNGRMTTDFTTNVNFPSDDSIEGIVLQNNQVVAAGFAEDDSAKFALARYDGVTGQIDTTVDPNSGGRLVTRFFAYRDASGSAISYGSDGKWTVVGDVEADTAFSGQVQGGTDPSHSFALANYNNADGTLDQAFGNGGKVVTPFYDLVFGDEVANAVVVLPDGSKIVGGNASTVGLLLKYKSDGSPDASFGAHGGVTISLLKSIEDIAVDEAGNIYATGPTSTTDQDFGVVKILPDGTLDRSFGNRGLAFADFSNNTDSPSAIALQSDGKIVVAGSTDSNGDFDFAVVRFTTSGNLDVSFSTDGKHTVDFNGGFEQVYDVVIDESGRILLAGSTQSTDSDFALARLESNGTLDNTFGTNGRVMTDFGAQRSDTAKSVVIQSGGFIVAAGYSDLEKVGHTDYDFALARYNNSGQLQGGFGTNGRVTTDFTNDPNTPSYDEINEIHLDSEGRIVAAGYGSSDNTVLQMARYDGVTGAIDTTLDPNSGGRLVTRLFAYGDTSGYALDIDSADNWTVAGYVYGGSTKVAVVQFGSGEIVDPGVDLADLDQQHGFSQESTANFNFFGANEKWLRAANRDWYMLLPDGSFLKWNGAPSATGTAVGNLGTEVYANPALLFDAYQPVANPLLAELDEMHGFKAETRGSFNFFGANEKWIRAENRDWYLLLPDGSFLKWDGNSSATGTAIANLGTDVYTDPALLFDAFQPPVSTDAAAIDEQFGFSSEDTSSFNAYGANEKWLRAANRDWYLLLPDGTLLKWSGVKNSATGITVASLGANVYADPSLLYNAYQPTVSTDPAAVDEELEFSSEDTGSFNAYGAGEKWLRAANRDWYLLLPDGSLLKWSGTKGSATGTPVASLGTSVYANPALLYDAFQVAISTDPVAVDQQYDFSAEATNSFNAYGANEKWLQAANKDWYLLLPDGSLLKWSGVKNSATGTTVATLGTAVYANPALLYNAFQQTVSTDPVAVDQQYGFTSEATSSFNAYNASEKWLQAANKDWFLLLPDGSLLKWSRVKGSATGTTVASLGTAVYANPALLFNASS